MKLYKKAALTLLIIFMAIQLIQPVRNSNDQVSATDFTKVFEVPADVQSILKNACYDCHSNHTIYPWYSYIQPVAWLQKNHIDNGKVALNFSDFGSYSNRRKTSKLKGIANQVTDDEMPLSSYKIMHRNARLSEHEKTLLTDWINAKADSLSNNN